MFECNVMAWESVIYKSKLLCESINKHDMLIKNYFRVKKKLCKNSMVIRHSVEKLSAKNSVTRP